MAVLAEREFSYPYRVVQLAVGVGNGKRTGGERRRLREAWRK